MIAYIVSFILGMLMGAGIMCFLQINKDDQ